MSGVLIFELKCSSESCKWEAIIQELKIGRNRDHAVAMYIGSDLTECDMK
jgi:hypothetical protein